LLEQRANARTNNVSIAKQPILKSQGEATGRTGKEGDSWDLVVPLGKSAGKKIPQEFLKNQFCTWPKGY